MGSLRRLRLQQHEAPLVCRAAPDTVQASTSASSASSKEPEFYELYLSKPIGIKFARGRDGGAYVLAMDERKGTIDSQVTAGDKIMKVSASFGEEIWDALNFGQVLYAIKTRNGEVYLQMQRRFGDMTPLEAEDGDMAEMQFKAERSGGNYGSGTKEIQQRNYMGTKEKERKRREMFEDALDKFRAGALEEALITFENVIGLEPKNYVGDDFSRSTPIFRVTQYNVACCYSSLKQELPGLEALELCMATGFEDFKKIRSDPNLEWLRKSPRFKKVMDKYDEQVINVEALSMLKNFFGKK